MTVTQVLLGIWSIFIAVIGLRDLSVGAITTGQEGKFLSIVLVVAGFPWIIYKLSKFIWGLF